MGFSASASSTVINNNAISAAYAGCPSVGSVNIVNINDVNFNPNPACGPNSTISVGQQNEISATCLISQLSKQIVQLYNQLNSTSKGGLGFNLSVASTWTETDVQNYLISKCGPVYGTNIANISDVDITACNFVVVQDATLTDACVINEAQSLINLLANTLSLQLTGGSLFGYIFGSGVGGAIVGIIVIVAVAAGIGYYFLKSSPEPVTSFEEEADFAQEQLESSDYYGQPDLNNPYPQMGGGVKKYIDELKTDPESFTKKIKNNIWYIVLTILIIIFIAFMIYNYNKNQTNNNLEKIKSQISENLKKSIESDHNTKKVNLNELDPNQKVYIF